MISTWRRLLLLLSVGALSCSSGAGDKGQSSPSESIKEGLQKTADGWTFKTAEFSVDAGQEKYLCYAVPTTEKMAISRFSSAANPVIHHFLFSDSSGAETPGFTECNVLFKATWAPMFVATTASANIAMPAGAAKLIDPGSFLVLQLHILNTTAHTVTSSTEVSMQSTDLKDPIPVGIYAFGTSNISLPPSKTTTVEADCTLPADVHLFAMLPHMHFLGRRLEIDTGPDEGSMTQTYLRDPYDFNDQYIEDFDVTLKAGTHTRTLCSYENTGASTVTFGESSHNEMCFAVGFSLGGGNLGGCIDSGPGDGGGVPREADAGVCGEVTSSTGVGKPCTKGGSECATGQLCSADQVDAGGGICIQLGCSSNADCGNGGATCCTPAEGGGIINICIPEACRPADCTPVK